MTRPKGTRPGFTSRRSVHNTLAAFGLSGTALTVAMVGLSASALPAHAEEAENSLAIEEIVVTARKREERLVDTPVAVAAMGQEEVERY